MFRCFLALAGSLVCLSPLSAGYYPPAVGRHKVEVVKEVVLKDARRKKTLPVALCFPREAGAYPVIVFSHGAFGSGDRVLALPRFWASHGYVCLAPTHADSLKLRRQASQEADTDVRAVVD